MTPAGDKPERSGQARGHGGDAPPERRGMSPGPKRGDLLLPNVPEKIRDAEQALLHAVSSMNYSEASGFAIRLALEEALYNAFRHGHRNLPDELVRLTWSAEPDKVVISVEDQGPGFNPEALPDPTSSDRLELPHGRGVMLMRAYMSSVEYNRSGNRVTMVYLKPDSDS